jgi:hypothetical protein
VDEAVAEQELKARSEVEALSAKLHHLVSTKTVAGIYNSPMHDGYLPTAFAIPIEQHLRNAIKPQIREEMRRSAKGKLTNTKPKLSLTAASLAREPYRSDDEWRRKEERINKAGFIAGEFHTSTSKQRTIAGTQQSIHAGTPYIDGGVAPLSRSTNKASWISSKVHARASLSARYPPPRARGSRRAPLGRAGALAANASDASPRPVPRAARIRRPLPSVRSRFTLRCRPTSCWRANKAKVISI